MEQAHEEVVRSVAARGGVVVLLGGLDSGKTTLGRLVGRVAINQGKTVAFVDSDISQSTVGPPSTVGLKLCRTAEDFSYERMFEADVLHFVGAISPQGHLISLLSGTARLVQQAKDSGADLIILDTSGLVSGIYGQQLKYHKLELVRPDVVIALQRGQELDPLVGIVQRFFAAEVHALTVDAEVVPTSVDQRAEIREESMRRYFREPLQRWRVRSTVFMPTLPALFDLRELDHLLVGLSDGKGSCLGVGYLEHSAGEDVLRLVSPAAEAPKALRLGSLRLDDGFGLKRVDLGGLFGSE
ncbi:MAG: Clp1/GlmU family protein [Actinomycetota bacterium]